MTIEELIEEHGREEIELQVSILKCCDTPFGILTPLGREVLEALQKGGWVKWYVGNRWETTEKHTLNPAYTYRIKSDYVLSDNEPKVFWGEKYTTEGYYDLPSRLYRIIKNYDSGCPLCEWFYNKQDSCKGCPLCYRYACYQYERCWAKAKCGPEGNKQRQKAAARIVELVEKW